MKLSLGCANTPVASGGGKGEVHCFCPLSILKWVGVLTWNEVGHFFVIDACAIKMFAFYSLQR